MVIETKYNIGDSVCELADIERGIFNPNTIKKVLIYVRNETQIEYNLVANRSDVRESCLISESDARKAMIEYHTAQIVKLARQND